MTEPEVTVNVPDDRKTCSRDQSRTSSPPVLRTSVTLATPPWVSVQTSARALSVSLRTRRAGPRYRLVGT